MIDDKQAEQAIVEAAEQAIDRAQAKSKQPRFDGADAIFEALERWYKLAADLTIPAYSSDSRKRDQWLQAFWKREPLWAGVINQLTLINAGRGWTITGGRNQVRAYTDIAHNAEAAPGLVGWRPYLKAQVQSYYTTDMNALTELGRDGVHGPVRAMYHLDSARCKLTGNATAPLQYFPASGGRSIPYKPKDFFRVAANPLAQEKFRGLGFCATSMAFELIKILYAVWMHDQEKLGARMPEGMMLLEGVSQTQWTEMLAARKANLDADLRRYFGGLFVLFNEIGEIDAKLVALSSLPDNFDRVTFVDQTIYGYALITGMDPSEFWPVQFGSLGRGRETEIQHRKAATKGAYEFASSYAEQINEVWPESLLFEFEERDAEGELLDAEVAQAWAEVAKTLYEAGANTGAPLLDQQKVLSYLVDKQVIPPEWSEMTEESVATDTEPAERERLLEMAQVQRAREQFADEPIVRYHWPSGRETVLWEPGRRRRLYPVRPRTVQRQEGPEAIVLFEDPEAGIVITQADVDRAIDEARRRVDPEFAQLLDAPTLEEGE